MHAMFVHPSFPGPFAAIANYLRLEAKWDVTLMTHVDTRHLNLPFTHVNYRLRDDLPSPPVFTNPDDLNGLLEHMAAIYRGLRDTPALRPDLVVGHVTFGTILYLRNIYHCPFIGYFELYPGQFWNDGLVLRKEWPPTEVVRLINATYHALTLMHLHAVDAAYTPTKTQLETCPAELRHKVKVLPEGVDCQIFQPRPRPTKIGDVTIDPDVRVVTYVSRGLESTRGFDIFMKVAKRILERRQDVLFVVSGAERTNHGHELPYLNGMSFKQWVLSQDEYDLSKFVFLGAPTLEQLTATYNASDLHISLSVPYVPSPSLLQAMASGCAILGSDTLPLREYIKNGTRGLLVDFYDLDKLTERALMLLSKPEQAKKLGESARTHVLEHYEFGECLKRQAAFFAEFDKRQELVDQALAMPPS